ncbi:MAG: hypothetical protein ACXQS8_08645 [Candidatus Helarchaeales archaeon]
MKFNHEYIPIIILLLFIQAMFMECLQLVQATGDIIYLLLIIIPTPVMVLAVLVAIFKIRKNKSNSNDEQ